MLLFFVILDFSFCFLVKVRFLVYLKLCEPPSDANFIIIIFKESKFVNLELTFAGYFDHLKYYVFFI